jgi:gliding motility-associated lipoprotein GldD
MMRFLIPVIVVLCSFASCGPDTYTPRPRGYFRISFPERGYQPFDKPDYPYGFEYPVYARIIRDTVFFDEKPDNPYWINMDFPDFNAQVFMTYKEIKPGQPFEKLIEDAYKMSYFHDIRADYIADHAFQTPNNVHGIYYNVGGNAASNIQFYATDSVKHFLWGALYFNVTPNADSLKPVNEFIRKDLDRLIETLYWK